jgi:glycosyltransferase involved in cell wall biosynthesis
MMNILAWIVVGLTLIQLSIAVINLVFRSRLTDFKTESSPMVSILIPARNEEENIVNILSDILRQEYTNYEVIVCDDNSSDRTSDVVISFSKEEPAIRLIRLDHLPEGWLGKNRACHSLASSAKGEYMLFLDADVRIGNGLIRNAVAYASRYSLALVSIFPKQILMTSGEKITIPNMNFILLSLLPLVLVRKSRNPSLAAANGQFMLFRSDEYRKILPHEQKKDKKAEDIEISRMLKIRKKKVACLVGDDSIKCRMYNGFRESINGFSKNVAAFFGGSLLLAFLFWIVTTFGFILVLLRMSPAVFIAYSSSYLLIRIIISVISEQDISVNLLYLVPQQFSCGLFIFNSFINRNFKAYRWKGRYIK